MNIDTYAVTTKRNKVEYDAISIFGVKVKEGTNKKIEISGIAEITAAFVEQTYTHGKFRSIVHLRINGRIIEIIAVEPQVGEKGSIAMFNLVVIAKVTNRDKLGAKEITTDKQLSLEGFDG